MKTVGRFLGGVLLLTSVSSLTVAQETDMFMQPELDVSVPDAHLQTFLGVVYPKERFLLSLAVSGVVAEVQVQEGDFVQLGDILLTLDQSVEAIELSRLNALLADQRLLDATRQRLALQRQQVAAVQKLYEQNQSVTLNELITLQMNQSALEGELAALEVDRMRAQYDLDIAEALLAQRVLRAPSPGFITQIRPKRGEWAPSSEPVIELVDTTINYIRVQVSDAKAATLLRDQSVAFSIQGESGQGWISFISPVADPASGLVEVQVSFENPDDRWRPGLQAEVRL